MLLPFSALVNSHLITALQLFLHDKHVGIVGSLNLFLHTSSFSFLVPTLLVNAMFALRNHKSESDTDTAPARLGKHLSTRRKASTLKRYVRCVLNLGHDNAIAGAGRVSQQFSAETPPAKKAWDVLLVIMLFLDEILGHTVSGAMNTEQCTYFVRVCLLL